jgi:DNA-binding CsgD family transcriptional regulator
MSAHDIRAGVRWSTELAGALETTRFGIVCLTEENRLNPWVLFEAGAISRTVERGRVIPYLVDIPIRLLDGPLSQFQARVADESGTHGIVEAINATSPPSQRLRTTIIDESFQVWWPQLRDALATVELTHPVPKVRRPDIRIMTTSDLKILELLAAGKPSEEIAASVQVSPRTLKWRVRQLQLKLNATNQSEAVELAKEFDLL